MNPFARGLALFGSESGRPICAARVIGDRVECVGLVEWLVPQTLDHIGDYWLGHFGEHGQATPASSVLFTFGLAA